jgi:hypothetical protein
MPHELRLILQANAQTGTMHHTEAVQICCGDQRCCTDKVETVTVCGTLLLLHSLMQKLQLQAAVCDAAAVAGLFVRLQVLLLLLLQLLLLLLI